MNKNTTTSPDKQTILLVEDEAPLRTVVTRILTQYGYHVLEAASGTAALRVWDEHWEQIELLFTDMILPDGLSGQELAERLKAKKPGLKVIFTTGYSPEVVAPNFPLREGANFLLKPYRPADLVRLVKSCF